MGYVFHNGIFKIVRMNVLRIVSFDVPTALLSQASVTKVALRMGLRYSHAFDYVEAFDDAKVKLR